MTMKESFEDLFVTEKLPGGGMIISLRPGLTWDEFDCERERLLRAGKLDHLLAEFSACIEARSEANYKGETNGDQRSNPGNTEVVV